LEIERHRSKTPITDEQVFSNFNRVRAGEEYQAPNNQRLADQELFATIPPGVKKMGSCFIWRQRSTNTRT
jgi:hypothetical protein